MSVNPILIQKVLRENANDLHDFSNDLKSWGEQMKEKEESLKKGKEVSSVRKKLPKPKKEAKNVKGAEKPKASFTKMGSTDYAAWDKFDVDAELNKLEDDIKDDSDLTDECNESMYDEAIVEKEKGNKYVKNQQWDEAIKCYTKAIDCYSYDPVFYANRALCYLKLSKFEEAENDCNLSLKLDDTYVKAYQRRAAARMQVNKLEHAEIDLQKVLIIEPNNKESKAELQKLSVVLKRNKEKTEQRPTSKFTASRNKSSIGTRFISTVPKPDLPKEETQKPEKQIDDSKPVPVWPLNEDTIEIKPIKKPPHLRSKNPLKRIEISEIGGIEIETKVSSVSEHQEPLKKHVIENYEITGKPQETHRPISAFKKQKSDKHFSEKELITEIPNTTNKLACLRTEDLKVIEKLEPSTTSKDFKNTVNDSKKLTDINEPPSVYPKNSVQFYASWKSLKSSEDRYKFFKTLEPRDIPKLFLNSLDSAMFSEILEVLVKHFSQNNDPIFDILHYFTEVKRFSAIVMFMSSEDKNNAWKLLDYIKETQEREKEAVDQLKEKFEL